MIKCLMTCFMLQYVLESNVMKILTWKLFFIDILDEKTTQNGIFSLGGAWFNFKTFIAMFHSSFKSNAKNTLMYTIMPNI